MEGEREWRGMRDRLGHSPDPLLQGSAVALSHRVLSSFSLHVCEVYLSKTPHMFMKEITCTYVFDYMYMYVTCICNLSVIEQLKIDVFHIL